MNMMKVFSPQISIPSIIVLFIAGVTIYVQGYPIWSYIFWGLAIIMLIMFLRNSLLSRKKKISDNWIDDCKNRHGKLPPLPDYLLGVVNYYTSGEPISKGIQPITPSGQWWNSRVPSEQKQWRQLVEWLGQDPEDLLAHMRMMLPKDPKSGRKNKPFEQH